MPIKTPDFPPPKFIEMTEDEYLVREAEAEYKSEFRRGRVYAMSGVTEAHALITGNVFGEIHQQLKTKPCKAFVSDMRMKVAAAGLYTYPDVMVVCGSSVFDAKDKHAITNPLVIIEVLSKSTAAYDRGEKFGYYKKLDSLQMYILISQHEVLVECFSRDGDTWPAVKLSSLDDALDLPPIECRVSLREIYDKVEAGK